MAETNGAAWVKKASRASADPQGMAHDLVSLRNPSIYRHISALEEYLRSIRIAGVMPGDSMLSEPFGVEINYNPDSFVLYEAVSGHCYYTIAGQEEPVLFQQGDLLLVGRETKHAFAFPQGTPRVDVRDLLTAQIEPYMFDPDGGRFSRGLVRRKVFHGGGGNVFHLRMFIMFIDRYSPSAMVDSLVSPILLKGFATRNRGLIDVIYEEFGKDHWSDFVGQPICIRLVEALLGTFLIEAANSGLQIGALFNGLTDPLIANSVRNILQDPNKNWDIATLSKGAGLSRSAFSMRFATIIGMGPHQFVTEARMRRAYEMLITTSVNVATIASAVHYSTEAAFNRAFRRWCGATPGAVRSQNAAASTGGAIRERKRPEPH